QTMIQSLPLTLGVANEVWVVLDALRRQRNANDYTGQPITPGVVSECLAQAKALRKLLLARLSSQHAELVKKQR
ncbi:MAG TPA: DNA-binding protein, partial [Burkholderiaceae bacterium]|nr:DNA-binding protein [Burkholderiaceae bacterium]